MRGLPILAICRGAQALNVACGGTLHQHVPGHRQTETATEATHEVEIDVALAAAPHHAHPHARRELLPPPGGRPGRRGPAGRRARARRHDRGHRGRRLHRRRAVARRDARGAYRTSSKPSLRRLPVPNCAPPRDTLGGVPALTLRGVVKRFGALTAVDHLDLDVPEGTCVGLLGPNGAGKSTTMRLLTAQAIPDEGDDRDPRLQAAEGVEGRARPVRRRAAARQPRRDADRRAEPARLRAPVPDRARAPQGRGRARAADREPDRPPRHEGRQALRRHAPAAADRARARAQAAARAARRADRRPGPAGPPGAVGADRPAALARARAS